MARWFEAGGVLRLEAGNCTRDWRDERERRDAGESGWRFEGRGWRRFGKVEVEAKVEQGGG